MRSTALTGIFTKRPLNQTNASGIPVPTFDALKDALESLGKFDPRLRQVLELRYLVGLRSKKSPRLSAADKAPFAKIALLREPGCNGS